jgi:hypothetical protein
MGRGKMSKTCSICGYEAKHQGALNMHMYHCKMKNVPRETMQEETCKHRFRLLSVSSSIESKAYEKGYMEVCSLCQELR